MRKSELEAVTVKRFAVAMRRKLRENRYKDGWQGETLAYLVDKLQEEVDELVELVISDNLHPSDIIEALDEAADVANMAMMVADRFRLLLNELSR